MRHFFLLLSLSTFLISQSFSSDQTSSPFFKPRPQPLQSDRGLCPALSYFLGDNNGSSTQSMNNSNFCPMLQRTACTKKDFEELRKWWERPVEYSPNDSLSKISQNFTQKQLSRFQIRTRKLEDIASYTWEMLNMNQEIRKRARLILMADKGDIRCQRSAERFLLYRFKEENYRYYLKRAETCWRFTNDLQTKI